MSYVFSHAFIPLSILFIFSGKLNLNQKYILYLVIFGIFPDFDAVFHHRYTFHNIFILIIPILIFIFIKNYRQISGMITYYLSSHLILDTLNGGIAVLYPFSNKMLFLNAEIAQTYDLKNMIFLYAYGFTDKVVETITEDSAYGVVSSENFGMIILILIMIIIYAVYRFNNKN
jgi:membrane-bound metal-dependent hydrolase YbcI (DUF457 family)